MLLNERAVGRELRNAATGCQLNFIWVAEKFCGEANGEIMIQKVRFTPVMMNPTCSPNLRSGRECIWLDRCRPHAM